ncbi:hypothetical protein Tco_0191659 [Tanacetum coccineum]
MVASSSTTPFSLDLYYNGYFKLKPLTYIDSEMVTMNIDVTGFKFEDMKGYIETKTHSIVTGLYYFNKDDEFSDVASLDHLSEGEEELKKVRIK